MLTETPQVLKDNCGRITRVSEVMVKIGNREVPLRRVQTLNEMPSLTQKHFKKECDIQTILTRALKTGLIPISNVMPVWGGVQDASTLMDKLNEVAKIKSQFAGYPRRIRNMFNHNVEEYLAFLDNPDNRDEAIRLGLMPEKKQDEKKSDTSDTSKNEVKKDDSDSKTQK